MPLCRLFANFECHLNNNICRMVKAQRIGAMASSTEVSGRMARCMARGMIYILHSIVFATVDTIHGENN